jgi:hypothetical protein
MTTLEPSIFTLFKGIYFAVIELRAIKASKVLDPILGLMAFLLPIAPPFAHLSLFIEIIRKTAFYR